MKYNFILIALGSISYLVSGQTNQKYDFNSKYISLTGIYKTHLEKQEQFIFKARSAFSDKLVRDSIVQEQYANGNWQESTRKIYKYDASGHNEQITTYSQDSTGK